MAADASCRATVNVVEFAAVRRSRHRLNGVEIPDALSRSKERRSGIANARLDSQIVRQPSRLQARTGKQATEGIEDVEFGGDSDGGGNLLETQLRKMTGQLLAKGFFGHDHNRHSKINPQ